MESLQEEASDDGWLYPTPDEFDADHSVWTPAVGSLDRTLSSFLGTVSHHLAVHGAEKKLGLCLESH